MSTTAAPVLQRPAHAQPGYDEHRRWRGLYRLGAYFAAAFILLSLASFIGPLTGLPSGTSQTRLSLPAAAETLSWIAAHRGLFVLDEILFLAPATLTIVTFLALYAALRNVDAGWAAIGAALAIASLAGAAVMSGVAFALVDLSDQFASATTASQRSVVEGAATSLIALYNAPSVSAVMWPAGIVAVSIAMLRGVFPRWTAYLGLATGIAGVVGEAAFAVIGPVYALYGLLLLVWFIAVGWRLYRLGGV